VSWLLHLSDPHLGDVSPGQELDDEKVVLDQRDLETTQTVFKRTLAKLGQFVETHGKPAVVVVSGDLTYRARDTGFDAFVALLAGNDDVLPADRSKIVVVPGNHDVVWAQPAGTPARYAGFLHATREQGCATPLLDGIDFAADDETGRLLPGATSAPHLVADDDVLVVPINSSNYCGTAVDLRGGWEADKWEAALAPLGRERDVVMAQIDRLRRHDIARVSRPQIEALGRLFDGAGELRGRGPEDRRVRVAVLHHQLLPVSTREERKPFESLVNLGLVRQTLREYAIDLVLHGHKHEGGIYWDVVGASDGTLDTSLQRMLVISSPGRFDVNGPVMRALRLTGSSRARSVTISTFLGPSSQRRHAQVAADEPHVPLWLGAMDAESTERNTVRAPTTHIAYSRLRGLFDQRDEGQPIRNLVCQVDNPDDAGLLPPDYPGADERSQAWFDDLVDWWQKDRSELVDRGLVEFNHGERIYRRWGNQVKRAAHLLNKRDDSSRALIQLVAPRETGRYANDERDLDRGSFPAFTLAELSITKRDGRRHLDCFAYFRKQELQYWWPVNLAELGRIQRAVQAELHGTKPKLGRIVTFSAIALWAEALPRVAVPEIDRLVDTPGRLWALAAAVAHPESANEGVIAEWGRILDDLAGVGRARPPQPKIGIRRLLDSIDHVATVAPSTQLELVRGALAELDDQHQAQADNELNSTGARLIVAAVQKLRDAVQQALATKGETS
jgi:3',5'-cyclic AMP phosphodiesterase CpdA